MASDTPPSGPIKGRGSLSAPEGRFESLRRESFDDGWLLDEEETPRLKTTVTAEQARSIISRNQSPDVPFSQSVNAYRGCEHGCIYCFARPTHAYLNLSPGLDFETKLFYKPNAAELLDAELRKPGYQCSTIGLGTNTDPYQPIERELKVVRSLLEVMWRFRHPVTIVTKSTLVERDVDLLAQLAKENLAAVHVSVTTLRNELKRTLEPRTASPAARLRTISTLASAGIPVGVIAAPMIPFVNDQELEHILEAAKEAGARSANYILLRLPYEIKDLFREWLAVHYPLKADHVMSLIQQARGGKDNDPRFGHRMTGMGQYAAMLGQRFSIACHRLGLNRRNNGERIALDTSRFRMPAEKGDQMSLF
jgi:DNA repair photolyase